MIQNLGNVIFNAIEEVYYTNNILTLCTKYGIFNDHIISPIQFEHLYKNEIVDNIYDFLYNFCINTEFPDIELPAYNPKDHFLYQGNMFTSQAKEKKYKFTTIINEYDVAKYNEEKEEWEEIYAIIKTDGHFTINPKGYCDLCILFFTKEEWESFKQPEKEYYVWDFINEEWRDPRTLEEAKNEYKLFIIQTYNLLHTLNHQYYITEFLPEYADWIEYIIKNKKDYTNVYNDGVNSLKNIIPIITKNKLLFDDNFYIDKFLSAKKYLDGQKDTWINLIDNISSNKKIDEYKDLFKNYINDIYELNEKSI